MSSKKTRTIPVRVESKKAASTRPQPAVLPASPATQPAVSKKSPSKLRQPVHQLPTRDRHRLMWGIVAVGMFVIVLGWALTLGYELKNSGREFSLLSELTRVFRSYDLPDHRGSPQEQEIRQLEDQVFPQF